MISTKKLWMLSGVMAWTALAAGAGGVTACNFGGSSSGGGTGSSSGSSGSSSGFSGSSSGSSSGGDASSEGGTSSGGSDSGDDAGFCLTGTDTAPAHTAVALACGQDNPTGIAVHDGVVYWTNYAATGTIMSTPTTGGAVTTVAMNQDWPWAIVVDDANIYWTNYDDQYAPGGGSGTSGTVMELPLTGGGTPIVLASGLSGPTALAVDATNVYFANAVGGTIKSVPIASAGAGPVTTLASKQTPYGIAVQNGVLYWTNYTGTSSSGDAYVMSLALTQGAVVQVLTTADNAAGPVGIAVNGTDIFFAADNNTGTSSEVESMPLAGSASPTILAPGQYQAMAVALDTTTVYWLDNNASAGTLSSAPLPTGATPGPITVLHSNLESPTGLAVDASGVYYTGSGGGRVWRLTPL